MNLDLGTQYYLKALDYYPYNLESAIENLQYALSCEAEHPQALCLMGQIYMYQLKEYKQAKRYFQSSIAANINYPDNYRFLSILHIWLGEYEEAEKLLNFANRRPGQSKDALLRIKAMMYEYQGLFDKAMLVLKQARMICVQDRCIGQIKADIERLKGKVKQHKKHKENSSKRK